MAPTYSVQNSTHTASLQHRGGGSDGAAANKDELLEKRWRQRAVRERRRKETREKERKERGGGKVRIMARSNLSSHAISFPSP
jgi:hypothetical protein